MDATALAGALKWKWPGSTCDYWFDGSNVLNVYNWQGGTQPTNAEIEQAVTDYKASNDYSVPLFDFDTFWGQVYATLSFDAADALTQFSRAIELLWSYPNLPGIKPFLQSKVGRTYNGYVVLQADVDLVVAAFTAQGVVLP